MENTTPSLSKNLGTNLLLLGGGALVLYGGLRRSILGVGLIATGGALIGAALRARCDGRTELCFGEKVHREAKEHWDYQRPVPDQEMNRVDEQGLESFPASDPPSHSPSFT